MATATTSNPYAPNQAKMDFRSKVQELYRKRKDPEYVRYAFEQMGYDSAVVDSEIQRLTGVQSSQKTDSSSIPGTNIDQAGLTGQQQTALLYGQRLYTSGKILDTLDEGIANKGFVDSVKQKGQEMAVGGTVTNQFVTPEFQKYDQAKRDFVNATLRRESGAVISPTEFENAQKQYFPAPGDSPEVVAQKKANRELVAKGFLKSAGVSDTEIQFNDGKVSLNTPEEAAKWLQDNPSDPRADVVRKKLESVGYNQGATTQASQPNQQPEQGMVSKAADKIGSFLGIKKFGEGMGIAIFLKTTEGKDLQKKAAEGDKVALDTLQSILDEAPNAKELIGSAALTALNVSSGGLAGKGLSVSGKVAVGTATGGAFGLAGGMEQNKDASGIAKSTATGAVVGGVVSGAISGVQKLAELRKAKLPKQAEEAVGKIIQGKTKDVAPALKTLQQVDTNGVTTYAGLKESIKTNMKALGIAMDDILSRDATPRTLDQLTEVANVGGKEVKTNYVKQALDNLDELYTKTNDPIDAQKIKNLLEKANTQGLTLKEINDVAKRYGTEFGKKAFSKSTGEALTSVNATAYENTRSGVKSALRALLPDDTAKGIDKTLSEHINTSELVDKMIEKVNSLNQKIGERGIVERASIKIGKVADLLTGHGLRGLASGLLPSNVGLKTMNSLDLERLLQKNLSVIERLNTNPTLLKKALEKAGKGGAKVTLPLILNAVREIGD